MTIDIEQIRHVNKRIAERSGQYAPAEINCGQLLEIIDMLAAKRATDKDAIRNAALEEAAGECEQEYRDREQAGKCHPEGSVARDRCFAAGRAAWNCTLSVRALKGGAA